MRLGSELTSRYRGIALLARGGMADVLQATDENGKPVAIKLLRAGFAEDKEIVARFRKEASAASQLKSPHVVRIFDWGVAEGERPYMVMERLAGHDLAEEIERRQRLPLEEAASYLAQACHAIVEAHAAGVIHRDLKPRNIFLAEQGPVRVVKVLDFGIAKHEKASGDDPITLTQTLFGSPLYMAPETFRSAKLADARSDVWSLGVIFYEMLTGVVPFQRENALAVGLAVTKEEQIPPTQRVPELPRSCDVVIARALKKDPAQRYQSVREMLAAIEVYLPKGRNDTMAIPVVEGPIDDEPRTLQKQGVVTEFHMPAVPRASQPSVPDDALDAPTRMRSADHDPATVLRAAPGEATGARPREGETSRIERPVVVPADPAGAPAKSPPRSRALFALGFVAVVFGLGGWLLGKGSEPSPTASPAAVVAAEQPAATPPQVTQAAPPALAPPAAELADKEPVASAEATAAPEASAASPAETAEAAQPAAPGTASRPRKPTRKPAPKSKYTPEKI